MVVLIVGAIVFAFQPWSKRNNAPLDEKSGTGSAAQEQITIVLWKKDVAKGAIFTDSTRQEWTGVAVISTEVGND